MEILAIVCSAAGHKKYFTRFLQNFLKLTHDFVGKLAGNIC
jgi:hypothetical protein